MTDSAPQPESPGTDPRDSAAHLQVRLAHLAHLQAVIGRMSHLGAMMKGWAAALLTGIFLLSARAGDPTLLLIAFFVIIVFWGLDAYYLRLERGFRLTYDLVVYRGCEHRAKRGCFSRVLKPGALTAPPDWAIVPTHEPGDWIPILMVTRPSLWVFYGCLLVAVSMGLLLLGG